MHLLTLDEAAAWCRRHGIDTDRGGQIPTLRLTTDCGGTVDGTVPARAGAMVAMAQAILLADMPDPDVSDFGGTLLWLVDWGIWNEDSERAGMCSLRLMRHALSGTSMAPLEESPAHLFSAQEFVAAHALLALPLLYQWDAYLIPASGSSLARISHDGSVCVRARSEPILSRVRARFRAAGWSADGALG